MSSLLVSPAAWQEDFEREIPYYTRFFNYRLRFLTPERREEDVQEALVQTAAVFASQYRQHGRRTEHRYDIARYVLGRVKRGTSSTRPNGRNADLLDWTTLRAADYPTREIDWLQALATLAAHNAISPGFCLDLEAWIDALPDRLREYATLARDGTPPEEITRVMGVGAGTIARYRSHLKELWQEYIAEHGAPPA